MHTKPIEIRFRTNFTRIKGNTSPCQFCWLVDENAFLEEVFSIKNGRKIDADCVCCTECMAIGVQLEVGRIHTEIRNRRKVLSSKKPTIIYL